jgi:putative DNA primase/helicase
MTNIRKPTWLIDEVDDRIHGNLQLRRLLNAGFDRAGALVARADRVFDAFSLIILAMIGDSLPESLQDRSIVIPIKRKLPNEKVEPLDAAALAYLGQLGEKLATLAAQHHGELAAANPIMPEGMINRVADKWRMLLAIADAVGGHWPQTARLIAVRAAKGEEPAQSLGELVLFELRGIFAEDESNRLPSGYVVDSLSALEDRPWATFDRGRPITPQQLAQLLRPFGIRPRTIRFADTTAKGYYLGDCTDAFKRYLKPLTHD